MIHPHVCAAGAVVWPPEDLSHVLQYVHDGQQVAAVAGTVAGRLLQLGHHLGNAVSHKATLGLGQVLPCLQEVAAVRSHTRHLNSTAAVIKASAVDVLLFMLA